MAYTLVVALLLLFLGVREGISDEYRPDLHELVNETQKVFHDGEEMAFVWWIPEEYWRNSLEGSDPPPSDSQIKKFLSALEPYIIIVAAEGKLGHFGWDSFKTKTDIRSSIRLIDSLGKRHLPLPVSMIDPYTGELLSVMKPGLARIVGVIGQHMYFLAFPAADMEGRRIADGKKEGSFSITLGDKKFRWRLPLASLLPPGKCPTCNEMISGAYNFCPFDGTKLSPSDREIVRK